MFPANCAMRLGVQRRCVVMSSFMRSFPSYPLASSAAFAWSSPRMPFALQRGRGLRDRA